MWKADPGGVWAAGVTTGKAAAAYTGRESELWAQNLSTGEAETALSSDLSCQTTQCELSVDHDQMVFYLQVS